MAVRYMYRCSAAAWDIAFKHYKSGVRIGEVVGCKSQAVFGRCGVRRVCQPTGRQGCTETVRA